MSVAGTQPTKVFCTSPTAQQQYSQGVCPRPRAQDTHAPTTGSGAGGQPPLFAGTKTFKFS